MQSIYNYIPETNHVFGVYRAAAVLYLQFVLHVIIFRMSNTFCIFVYIGTFLSMCPVPNMAAFYYLLLLLLLLF